MYSFSEVAKLLKVSRQTVYNKIDKCGLQSFTSDTDKGKVINEEGFHKLKDILFPVNDAIHGQSNSVNDSKYIDTLIDSLKNENTHIKGILSEQSKQIDNLTRLLENSQVLQKQQQDKILLLEEPREVKPFWNIFKRK